MSEAAKITLKLVLETLLEEEREERHEFAGVPDQELGLRLGVSASQNIAFRLDRIREGDQIVRYEGANVLVIDPELARMVDGAVLDCVDTPAGPRLMISR